MLTVEYGRPPWIALLLAFSFGTYGLAKKQANVEAVESLTFETIVLAPFAFGFLVWLGATGRAHFLGEGVGHVLLLASTGVVTAVPLLCFGAAAIRVPMTTLGLLQYLAPVLQFALGVTVLHEAMTPMRWAGFALVWVALVIFTFDAVRHHRRRQLRLTAEACAICHAAGQGLVLLVGKSTAPVANRMADRTPSTQATIPRMKPAVASPRPCCPVRLDLALRHPAEDDRGDAGEEAAAHEPRIPRTRDQIALRFVPVGTAP